MMWELRSALVAEDNDDDFFLLERAFKKAKVPNPVYRLKNGNEVVQYLSGSSPYSDRTVYPLPYVLLLDLKLPIKHGFDVLEWVRNRAEVKILPVVILSSSQQSTDIRKGYELGANGFVTKSTSVDAMIVDILAISNFWLRVNRAEPDLTKTSRDRIEKPAGLR